MFITRGPAEAIVRRGTAGLGPGGALREGRVRWSHDVRIQTAVMHGMPRAEARAYLAELPRTLLLHCDPGMTYPGILERTATRRDVLAGRLEEHMLPGTSHHLHADQPREVAAIIAPWLLAAEVAGSR